MEFERKMYVIAHTTSDTVQDQKQNEVTHIHTNTHQLNMDVEEANYDKLKNQSGYA